MVTRRDQESQRRAIAAARLILSGETTKTIVELADENVIGAKSISDARILLHFGTEHEISVVEQGAIGLANLTSSIKERVGREKLLEFKKSLSKISERKRAKVKVGAELWSTLSLMFKGITDMPSPKDAVEYLAGSGGRAKTINAQLETVANWIKEFAYEWQFYQLGKHQEGATDARDGDSTS